MHNQIDVLALVLVGHLALPTTLAQLHQRIVGHFAAAAAAAAAIFTIATATTTTTAAAAATAAAPSSGARTRIDRERLA